jgi:hypothetical protein
MFEFAFHVGSVVTPVDVAVVQHFGNGSSEILECVVNRRGSFVVEAE